MKKFALPLIASAFLMACSDEPKQPEVNGNDYVGSWVNPVGQQSQNPNDVIINDRVIIAPSDLEGVFKVSILAKGVFTDMEFKPENGLLCAANDACFQLVDGKLKLGSEAGILTYEREQYENQ
ncbi:hypothetical protein NVT87_12435 [Acinetobacter radioresistens]|jgi:hypothetical protein|uniref:Lipoprotein n=2 Tax=Acinetobacter TaxID=469 RepID=N9FY90_ACILW|nr:MULTISPECIES: hypothetical protein [Acinetobacter]EET83859.1 hypothetical protein ACIRA0001_0418 [Acinetobacter radioresistens SK82]EJO33836.1 putative lipoprotein [Acinetobacter radioresistens WC-A-157]ELA8727645.1 hypothetical protein [Acinetobacter baumannii]ENW27567.1 hypothetical protein F923_03126 [Acinetobacter lwoffii NIPH 478]ENW98615.1 hypothetical protein F899_03078 [Acinetobacter sp. CIP 101934]